MIGVLNVPAWVAGFTRLISDLDTPDVVAGAADQVATTARRLAPTAVGHPRAGLLRSSITVRPTRGPAVFVGPWTSYSRFVHDGTRRMRARPFLTAAAVDPSGRVDQSVDRMIGRSDLA